MAITAWLPKGQMPDQIEFYVYGPPELLEFPEELEKLRPTTTEFDGSNYYTHGQRFTHVADAKLKFRSLIEKIVPKI